MPNARAAGKADCKSSSRSCNIFCRVSLGCGITCRARLAGSGHAARVKHNWKSTADACRNESRASSASWNRYGKREPFSDRGENAISGQSHAVVGYTNAGKSTLLNLLTGADVVAEDKLFATLDPTTRSFVLPNKQRVLLTDTVGFLRKLPHTLIESFKATLEEVSEADLLIHIVDLSHPRVDEQMEAVDRVIKELDAYGKQTLIVFNKIDNLANREVVDSYLRRFPGSVAISARTGEGVNQLVQALEGALSSWRLRSRFRIPAKESALIAEIHRVGHVLELRYEGNDALIVAHVPPDLAQKLERYAEH